MADYSHLSPENTPVVDVFWADITETYNWNEEEEPSITTHTTIGRLLEDNEKWVVIGGTYTWETQTWSPITHFPKLPPEVTELCPPPNKPTPRPLIAGVGRPVVEEEWEWEYY